MTGDSHLGAVAVFARHAAMGSFLLLLAACATPADPQRMAVTQAAGTGFPAKLQHAMCVRNVTGGEATNPLWVSEVDDAGFSQALSNSLSSLGLLAAQGSCRYFVDVDLLGLSQPTVGISMEVTSHANYKVYDAGGKPALRRLYRTAGFAGKESDKLAERLGPGRIFHHPPPGPA